MSSYLFKAGILAGLFVLLTSSTSWAQSPDGMPELTADPRTQKIHEQAEEVYGRGDYKRAYFIYRNDLAPIGDKYGQYMVGFMHLTGKGVEQDAVAASAWFRLAAERGIRELVGERDKLMASLDDEQRAESDRQFVDLRKQYGDLVLMTQLIRSDYEALSKYSGYDNDTGGSGVPVFELSDSKTTSPGSLSKEHYDRVERRLQSRLDYVVEKAGLNPVNWKSIEFDEFEEQVAAALDQLP